MKNHLSLLACLVVSFTAQQSFAGLLDTQSLIGTPVSYDGAQLWRVNLNQEGAAVAVQGVVDGKGKEKSLTFIALSKRFSRFVH